MESLQSVRESRRDICFLNNLLPWGEGGGERRERGEREREKEREGGREREKEGEREREREGGREREREFVC